MLRNPTSPRTRGEVSISRARINTQFLIQLLVNGLVVGTLYGVVAMSFVLIYKATQVVNFAQGELLLVGAWVCWALLTKFQVPFWIGMPLTLVFMFVVWPLKIGGLPPDMVGLFIIGFLLNAAWGIGWALFLMLLERMRSAS